MQRHEKTTNLRKRVQGQQYPPDLQNTLICVSNIHITVPLKLLPSAIALQNCHISFIWEVIQLSYCFVRAKMVTGNRQHRLTKGKSRLTNLPAFYDKMTGFVDEGRALDGLSLFWLQQVFQCSFPSCSLLGPVVFNIFPNSLENAGFLLIKLSDVTKLRGHPQLLHRRTELPSREN